VLGIAKAHHGAVAVQNDPGRGSTFRVFLSASAKKLRYRSCWCCVFPGRDRGEQMHDRRSSETDRTREAQKRGAGTYVKKPYLKEKIGVAVRAELDRE
jgi:hypothetical protein